MHIGSILKIDSHGEIDVELQQGQRQHGVVHAQIMTGGGNRGDRVEGLMAPGIRTWALSPFRTMVVNVFAADMQRGVGGNPEVRAY